MIRDKGEVAAGCNITSSGTRRVPPAGQVLASAHKFLMPALVQVLRKLPVSLNRSQRTQWVAMNGNVRPVFPSSDVLQLVEFNIGDFGCHDATVVKQNGIRTMSFS
jgi:hypothetical protein